MREFRVGDEEEEDEGPASIEGGRGKEKKRKKGGSRPLEVSSKEEVQLVCCPSSLREKM